MDKLQKDLDKMADVIMANVRKTHPEWDDFKVHNAVFGYYLKCNEVMIKFKQKYGYDFIKNKIFDEKPPEHAINFQGGGENS